MKVLTALLLASILLATPRTLPAQVSREAIRAEVEIPPDVNVASVQSASVPEQTQDGVIEIDVGDEGRQPAADDGPRDVDQEGGEEGPPDDPDVGDEEGDDPGDEDDGDTPGDEPLLDNICGPDVTAAYVEALKRVYKRIEELSDDEKGAFDGAAFLHANGANIDMVARALALPVDDKGVVSNRCPRGACELSVTIGGHCLPKHIANDIMYGVVARLLSVPWGIALAGAETWDLLQYHAFDPVSSKAAYAVGWEMADRLSEDQSVSEVDFKSLIEETKVIERLRLINRFVTILEAVKDYESYVLDCAPCPEPCTSDFTKDFTKTGWTLEDGRRVEYEP